MSCTLNTKQIPLKPDGILAKLTIRGAPKGSAVLLASATALEILDNRQEVETTIDFAKRIQEIYLNEWVSNLLDNTHQIAQTEDLFAGVDANTVKGVFNQFIIRGCRYRALDFMLMATNDISYYKNNPAVYEDFSALISTSAKGLVCNRVDSLCIASPSSLEGVTFELIYQ